MGPALWGCILLTCGCSLNPASEAGRILYAVEKQSDHIYSIGFTGLFNYRSEDVLVGWHREAELACQTADYYFRLRFRRTGGDVSGLDGTAYCNSGFVDTRQQLPDTFFIKLQELVVQATPPPEPDALWQALVAGRYADLEAHFSAWERIEGQDSAHAERFDGQFNALARADSTATHAFEGWRQAFPQSFYAGYATARHYHARSWHARGNGEWKTLTPGQIRGFITHKTHALQVLEATRATGLQRELVEALRIDVLIGGEDARRRVPDAYRAAIRSFPDSMLIRAAYFRYLLPRWYGSQEELDALVAETKRDYGRNPQLIRLQALHSIELGDQLWLSDKPEDALGAYQQAIALSPDWGEAYLRLGRLLEARERYAEAIAAAKTALRLNPHSSEALRILAESLRRSGALVEALIAADRLTRIAPEGAAAFALRAAVQYGMRMYAEAEVSYERAAQLDNGDPFYRHMVRRAAFQLSVRRQKPPDLATAGYSRELHAS